MVNNSNNINKTDSQLPLQTIEGCGHSRHFQQYFNYILVKKEKKGHDIWKYRSWFGADTKMWRV